VIIEVHPEQAFPKHLAAVDAAVSLISASTPELQQWFEEYVRYHRTRIAIDLRYVERFVGAEALGLDCGAAPFIFTLAMQQLGRRIHGLDKDPSRFAETLVRNEIEVIAADLEVAPWPVADATYDFIVFNEVFEHTANLLAAFTGINRALKMNGILLMSTPNGMSAASLLRMLTGHLGPGIFGEQRKRVTLGHMGHIREYTPQEVTTFCWQMGFRTDFQIHRGHFGRDTLAAKIQQLLPTLAPFTTYVLRKVRDLTDEMISG
jgi:SAM-dependent methyltransferase